MASVKVQSAVEYLSTYGWAILIIAVVLAALFWFGVFNPNTFAPKAQAGTCQVVTNGQERTLSGVCNNEIPQFVAQFNGATSYITTTAGSSSSKPFTISAWVDPYSGYPTYPMIADNPSGVGLFLGINTAAPPYVGFSMYSNGAMTGQTFKPAGNQWYYVVGVYNGSHTFVYVNGVLVGTSSGTSSSVLVSDLQFGNGTNAGNSWWDGLISNVQFYNTSMSANDIYSLYIEGIGGAPISPRYLVGWWPLNGNANDYSGNANNGQASNIIYNGNWWGSYSQP